MSKSRRMSARWDIALDSLQEYHTEGMTDEEIMWARMNGTLRTVAEVIDETLEDVLNSEVTKALDETVIESINGINKSNDS